MPPTRSLSPEGFASILWKDGKRAKEAAGIMKITAKDLKELGVIEWSFQEVEPAQKKNLETIAGNMKDICSVSWKNRKKKAKNSLP